MKRGKLLLVVGLVLATVIGVALTLKALWPLPAHKKVIAAGQTVERVRPVSLSSQMNGVECTVSIPSTVVQPAEKLGATFSVTNVSGERKEIDISTHGTAGSLRYYDASGLLVADTSQLEWGIVGGIPIPKPLAPGDSMEIGSWDAPITWGGPLSVVPVCQRRDMTSVANAPRITVAASGPTPSAQEAIDRATVNSWGVLDSCRPSPSDGSVVRMVPRGGQPVAARCEALVEPRPGFDVVLLAAITPPDAPKIDLARLSAEIGFGPVPFKMTRSGDAVSWWIFVVTPEQTILMKQYGEADCARGGSAGPNRGLVVCAENRML